MAKKKSPITGLPSGIIDDIFLPLGKAAVQAVRRDVRKVNKGLTRTTGGLALKPHMRGAVGKSNMTNPRFMKMSALEDKTDAAFIKQMGGRKKAGAKAAHAASWEEFEAVEKRAIKRAAAKKTTKGK